MKNLRTTSVVSSESSQPTDVDFTQVFTDTTVSSMVEIMFLIPDLDPYDRQVSWNLNTGLRHHVGKTGNHPGFGLKCGEAG